jgi:pimeloyl-ACP methyl ester carboxylesterase
MEIRPDTVTASGLKFGVLTCGEAGPLALCLHGFPDCAQTFRHLLPSLADAGFRAVAPWLRGYEPTGIPATGDYSLNALAADANALHEVLGGDGEAVLIGHDWGAMTSYVAGTEAPDRWRRMVTMAVPPPKTASAAFMNYRQLKRSFYIFLFQTGLAPIVGMNDLAFIDGLWSDWSPGYDGSADLEGVKQSLRNPDNLMAAIGYYRAMFDPHGTPSSSGHQQPTLYLHGDQDGAFGVEGVAGAHDELPAGSRVEIVAGTGHFLHLEKPAEVNRLILDWVAST